MLFERDEDAREDRPGPLHLDHPLQALPHPVIPPFIGGRSHGVPPFAKTDRVPNQASELLGKPGPVPMNRVLGDFDADILWDVFDIPFPGDGVLPFVRQGFTIRM